MSYQPGVPTGFIPINQDYSALKENFTQLEDQFLVDHVPLSSTSGTPPNGYHESIHLVPQSTTATNPPNNQPVVTPTATPGYGQLFNAEINDGANTDTVLYFLSGGNRITELTRNIQPVAAQNGYTFIPGGLILQWAQFTAPAATGTVNFNILFPAACFLVILQGDDNNTANENLLVVTRTASNFSYKSLGGGRVYTYLALGN